MSEQRQPWQASVLISIVTPILMLVAGTFTIMTYFVPRADFDRQVATRSAELSRMQDDRVAQFTQVNIQLKYLNDLLFGQQALLAKIQERQEENTEQIRNNHAESIKKDDELEERLRTLEYKQGGASRHSVDDPPKQNGDKR